MGNRVGYQSSAYIRVLFTVNDPAEVTGLTLLMRYDDGFVAYLNGVEIANRLAPASPAGAEDVVFASARLEAEVIRDSILKVSGQLNPKMGGPGYRDFKMFKHKGSSRFT